MKKKEGKKGKEASKGVIYTPPPRRADKLNFFQRNVKRNRNEIETQKQQILSLRQKEKNNNKEKQ